MVYDFVELPGTRGPITFTHIIDYEKEKVFEIMTNVQEYPKILPGIVIEVEIMNTTNNVIITKESLHAKLHKVTLTVKHTIIPSKSHEINRE